VYDVKRVAPGEVTSSEDGRWFLNHDCSTLGGASGSVLGDVETGQAVGLHFGGSFRKTNYAVTAATIRNALTQLKVVVTVPGRPRGTTTAAEEAKTRPASYYKDRVGYEDDFLGPASEHRVPLPKFPGAADVVPVAGATGNARGVLRFRHFSVVLSKSRRMALCTAVNIDGNQLRNIPRKGDAWYLDPRVAEKFQTGEDVYSNNDLDRGHMVRRLDPVWGSEAEARDANEDTFHYANACPQHKDLNQRTWNDMEEYILGISGAHQLKVCVFTGPVLRKDDPPYRGVRLPREFWKVAVLINDQTGKLSTTGYMLSQAGMIKDLTEFVFGKFRTYQVPVARIEKLTGLNFGKVADADPLKGQELIEAVDGPGGRVIERPGDIVF
jgi:endonuclease G